MAKVLTHTRELPDTQQSVWGLTVIQLSGWISLPILATSLLILQENTFYGSVLTIIVGNAILWFIRFGIVAMSYKNRQSTLDVSREYLGNWGSLFIAAILVASTLVWFIAQTTAASNTLTNLISIHENPSIDRFTQMSVLLGILSTFLCMQGIIVLRWLSSLAFPILLITFVIVMFSAPFHLPEEGTSALSLSGLALVLGTNLGITSDIPTFFRHSRSFQTSVYALTVIQIMSLLLALCSLFFGSIINRSFDINNAAVLGTEDNVLRISLIIFVFLSVICANVANIYSASVGWEVIAPSALVGRKEYLVIGLGLTTIFVLLSNIFSVNFLISASDSSLVNLCLVLILGYIISRLHKRPPNSFEQKAYFSAWLLSSLINIFQYADVVLTEIPAINTGLLIIFVISSISFIATKISR